MKKWSIIIAVTILLIAIVFAVFRQLEGLYTPKRRAWKEKTIAEISTRVADPAWPGKELARLAPHQEDDFGNHQSWMTDRILVAKNGEWLAYANVCGKEKEKIRDLFLALGSDGRWYYSTDHFCVGMYVMKNRDQPESLADFAATYYARTFDGKSDDCLANTDP